MRSPSIHFNDGVREFALRLVGRQLVLWCDAEVVRGLDQQALKILVVLTLNANEEPERRKTSRNA